MNNIVTYMYFINILSLVWSKLVFLEYLRSPKHCGENKKTYMYIISGYNR